MCWEKPNEFMNTRICFVCVFPGATALLDKHQRCGDDL